MQDWQFVLWNEDNFDINYNDYTREAYEAKKYAFVSDVARLVALKKDGGVYLDTDVEVLRPLDALLGASAFTGFEGSKYLPIGTSVIASEPNGQWISEMLEAYESRHFVKPDGSFDLTTNVQLFTSLMVEGGLQQNGIEQDYKDCHVFPVTFFSPRQTTGELLITENTYCDHKGVSSWTNAKHNWKAFLLALCGRKSRTRIIKLKRKLLG